MNKPEILSPAGDFEKLCAAIAYGADAVYLSGFRYGLRTGSGNFSPRDMESAIRYAQSKGVRCYIAMNILARPADFRAIDEEISFIGSIGADAFIVSDPGIFNRIRSILPDAEIHISTQASVTNAEACRFWHALGARRIVLARELSLAEIAEIRSGIPDDLELECFVHGAMCVSYSGRCLLSNVFTGRSANLGDCAQPCRWEYRVSEVKRPEEILTVEGDDTGSYIFNSKDLCMIDHIPALIAAGINSFKIEGRVKGSFYAASVTRAYREAVDAYCADPLSYTVSPQWHRLLNRTVHREFGTGFFFDRPQDDPQLFPSQMSYKPAFVVGMVTRYEKSEQRAYISQRNKLSAGDELWAITPDGREIKMRAEDIRDENGASIESTPHPQMNYSLYAPVHLPEYSFLSKDGDKDLPARPSGSGG